VIEGIGALLLGFFSFVVPMAIPLMAQRWRTLLAILAVGAVFFGWLTLEMPVAGSIPAGIGAFLGGLMLFGFAAGTIARFVMLLGRRQAADSES
jgi:hypothetical protein